MGLVSVTSILFLSSLVLLLIRIFYKKFPMQLATVMGYENISNRSTEATKAAYSIQLKLAGKTVQQKIVIDELSDGVLNDPERCGLGIGSHLKFYGVTNVVVLGHFDHPLLLTPFWLWCVIVLIAAIPCLSSVAFSFF